MLTLLFRISLLMLRHINASVFDVILFDFALFIVAVFTVALFNVALC